MALTIQKLTDHFGAEITGLDLTANLDDAVVSEIKAALDEHSVLVFRNQRFDDETQTAFSARFGALETTVYKPEGDGGVPVANITNVDFRTNELFPEGHSRLKSNSGNEMWHTDSSFKSTPAYCSMLSGREVPPIGADTQFASCRTAYDSLPEAERLQLDGLVAEHNYGHSRSLVKGYSAPQQTLNEVPPVRHAVVRTNPATGRKNFYSGSHASHIIGWPVEKGRQLLRDLVDKSTLPDFVYAHKWRQFDFVIWDNRCILHRGTPYDTAKYRRVMRRTTVAGTGPTVSESGDALAVAS
jgi:alpha-ketoglutarate-dependent 2,4-dichlorophenoxyacetate dioxygenase